MKPILAEQVDFNEIGYTEIKRNTKGGKSVFLYYHQFNQSLIIQTPYLLNPFGIGTFNKDENKYFIDLSFANANKNPEIEDLLDIMTKLDNKILEDAKILKHLWFSENTTNEEVEKMYKPMVRYTFDKNGNRSSEYPPTIKLKLIRKDDGNYSAIAFNTNKEIINIDESVKKNSKIKAIIECSGIWFHKDSKGKTTFGCTWKINQMVVRNDFNLNKQYAFIDDEVVVSDGSLTPYSSDGELSSN
jgi:hypothetical protein